MRVLLPSHDTSVHKILKVLASITPVEYRVLFPAATFPLGKEFCNCQPKCTWKFHPPAKVLPLILSVCALILLGSLDFPTVPHHVFYCHQKNQRLHISMILSSMSSLPYLQVALSACESGMHSRIILLGKKCFVNEKVGACFLALV